MIKTQKVKIYPNAHMRHHIQDLFDYRRYCWNQALGLWNDMYDESVLLDDKSLRPSEYKVRNELVHNKQDWQYRLSARVLQQTSAQLDKSWQEFFNPNMPNHKRPKFKSKKNYKPTFTTDRARLTNGKLILDKPHGISKAVWYGVKLAEPIRFTGKLKTCTITEQADGLYASLTFNVTGETLLPRKHGIAGVDANVKHFNFNDGSIPVYPDKLEHYYDKIAYYQKCLARKRVANPRNYKTNRYAKVKIKLRRLYRQVNHIQQDILHKFTTRLINHYTEIHIEDLNVHGMQMSKRMGKNLHRSMFGQLAEQLQYKSAWYGRKLILVDRSYPSTQICSECGFRKTNNTYGGKQTLSGDSIHHQHQRYYCYNCGVVLDRDENAVQNIINYRDDSMRVLTQ